MDRGCASPLYPVSTSCMRHAQPGHARFLRREVRVEKRDLLASLHVLY